MRNRSQSLITPLLALVLAGCPMTDALEYAPGDEGTATFENLWRKHVVWLGGCTTFVQEELVGEEWIDRGGEFDCFWEGFARPVAPKEQVVEPFTARDAGRWRLAYDVGFGCSADEPLTPANCLVLRRVPSVPFDVVAPPDDEGLCVASGGIWDPLSCGDYVCGYVPECEAIIPGCDCGLGNTFVPGVGCEPDPSCVVDEQALCEATGGTWDPTSCGHWQCGYPPVCAAVIPGCNCGPSALFVDDLGCLPAPCGVPQ